MPHRQDDPVPIRLVARREACRNTKLKIHLDTIESDTYRVEDYMVVVPLHHVSERLESGVTVLPVLDGRIGLQRVYRHPIARWVWEAPRGFIDANESPAEAAARELEEETGLVCRADDLMPLSAVAPEGGVIQGRLMLFAALNCQTGGRRDDAELGLGRLHWLAPADVLAMADSGEIEDATTLVAIYRLSRLSRETAGVI